MFSDLFLNTTSLIESEVFPARQSASVPVISKKLRWMGGSKNEKNIFQMHETDKVKHDTHKLLSQRKKPDISELRLELKVAFG